VLARLDLTRHLLTLVDCGHTRSLHGCQANSTVTQLQGYNLPLGVDTGEIYRSVSVPFAPGDRFLFYSDGVTEARSPGGEAFGVERLSALFGGLLSASPKAIIGELHRALDAFCGGDPPADDVTVVVVETGAADPVAPTRAERFFPADLARLPEVRAFTRAAVRSVPGLQVDPERLAGLERAVDEVASNIVRHAFREESGKSFSLVIKVLAPAVEVVFGHNGLPFDLASVPPPTLDGTRDGGFGLYIINKSVDSVRYTILPDMRHGVILHTRVGVEPTDG